MASVLLLPTVIRFGRLRPFQSMYLSSTQVEEVQSYFVRLPSASWLNACASPPMVALASRFGFDAS
ncbi:MAG: hypothetical protein OXH52_18790 [Gammaproteobacteria bacterium]|nr:hypothetical protein [Gammaproteobacteria bacterium]